MYNRLYSFLQTNNILYQYQFGFRENHSTTLALLDVVDQINAHLDKHESVVGVLHEAVPGDKLKLYANDTLFAVLTFRM